MYRALALVCLIVVSQAGAPANTQNLQFGSDDFLNFVKGFLAGIGSDLQLQEIVTCYDDVSSGVEYALEAEKYCKEEGIWNKTKCLYYKAEALKELPGAILSCKSAFTTDAKTIATAISEVENPISVVYHVGKEFIFNGGEIYSEFSSACKDWQSGDYYNSGVEFGKVFGIIFVTDGSSLAAVNGFLKGTETSIRLNEIYECLEYLELTKQFMVKGMEILMQSETEEDVLASLGFINGYYSMIYESAKNCNSDESELSKLAAQMKLAADKTSQSFNNGRVFIRGNDVTVQLTAAALHLSKHQYHLVGQMLGNMLINLKDNQNAINFTKGLLSVNGIDFNSFDFSGQCITDIQQLSADALALASNITSGNLNAIIQSLMQIKTDINNILQSCSPGTQTQYELLGAFRDFDKSKVFYLIDSGKNRIEAQDFEKAGSFFGLAMNLMMKNQLEAFPNHANVLEILNGVVHGMASDITIEDFQTCIVDGENISHGLFTAINLLKQGTISSVKSALQQFGQSLESVPGMIDDCTNAFEDSSALNTAIKTLKSPWSFFFRLGKSLMINGKEIYGDVEQALTYWQAEEWYNFGLNMGYALKALVEN